MFDISNYIHVEKSLDTNTWRIELTGFTDTTITRGIRVRQKSWLIREILPGIRLSWPYLGSATRVIAYLGFVLMNLHQESTW